MAIKIFIDQGHNPGNINAGTSGYGLTEAQITYQVGIYLAELLLQDGRFEVRLSRRSPEDVLGFNQSSSLIERVQRANEWPADYFVSIHVNYNVNPVINGTEVYVYQTNTQAYYLAQHVLNSIVDTVGTRDNLVRTNPGLYVLRRTDMPAILVELAYLSNASDAEKLRDDQYGFAYGIYAGLLSYFGL